MITQNLKINGKVIIIPKDKNRANRYMYHFAKHFQQNMKKNSNPYLIKRKRKNTYLQSLKCKPSPLAKSHKHTAHPKSSSRSQKQI